MKMSICTAAWSVCVCRSGYFDSTVSEKFNRCLSVCLAFFCGGMWSSGASQVILLPQKQWKVLGYQRHILTRDPWDPLRRHLVAPQTTLQCWLTLGPLFWDAHNGDMHTETYSAERHTMHSSEVTMYWTPWHTHPYSLPHGEYKSCTVSPKTTAACEWRDKGNGGKLSPAGEPSLWSTEEDESRRKACLTEPVCLAGLLDNPQRDTGDWSEEEKDLHRNSLEAGGTFCSAVKSTSEETNALRMKADHWCDHCLGSVTPHDIRRCLDHSLAYAVAVSAPAVVGCSLCLLASP